MRREVLQLLRCPATAQELVLRVDSEMQGEIETGVLTTTDGSREYPIRGFIPRFVPPQNYAANFGLQWIKFRRTQLDSVSGVPISRDRFYRYTGWSPAELAGKRILDVGCGAGRFAEIALDAGAHVVAVDYSAAVDACRANLGASARLDVIQGDVYALPFKPESFDHVYCLGVLQHTPDVERAFRSLPLQLRPGGKLAVDVYPWLLRNAMWSKYWLRPVTKRVRADLLFPIVAAATPALLTVSRAVQRIPRVGSYLRYLVPVANYADTHPLSAAQLEEWAVLDTFDMLAPAHDHPQKKETLGRWFVEAGLVDSFVERMGFIVGRGTKPSRP